MHRRLAEGDRDAHGAVPLEVRVIELDQVVVVPGLAIFHQSGVIVDGAAGHIVLGEAVHPVLAWLRAEGVVHLLRDPLAVLRARPRIDGAFVVDQVGAVQGGAELRPVVRGQHAVREPLAVASLMVGERGGPRPAQGRPGLLARVQVPRDGRGLDRHHGAEQRDIDLLPHAEALPGDERGHDRVGEHDAAHLVGEAPAEFHRRCPGPAGQRDHRARHPLRHVVVTAAPAPLARQPEPAVDRVDQLRVDGAQPFVADSQVVHDARDEVLHDHVHLLDKLVDDLPCLRRLDVERHALLAAVARLEDGVEAIGLRAQAAHRVAVARTLDFEHLGAHVGEHGGAVGPVLEAGEVEDLDPIEWSGHGALPFVGGRGRPGARRRGRGAHDDISRGHRATLPDRSAPGLCSTHEAYEAHEAHERRSDGHRRSAQRGF